MLSNVGIWELRVKGVLIFDDRAGEVGVVTVVGFALRVELGELKG